MPPPDPARLETPPGTEAEELYARGTAIVFAVDQPPFEYEGNWFGLLVPLFTRDGRGLQADGRGFPNRGRVWWMLSEEVDHARVVPGTLWTSYLEHTRDHGKNLPRKDWFQVRKWEVQAGAEGTMEVLDVREEHPSAEDLLGLGLAWPRPVLGRVVVRGTRSALGPFRAQWDPARLRLRLEAVQAADPWIYRLKRESLDAGRAVQEFTYLANQWYPEAPVAEVRLALLPERKLRLFEEEGEKVDGLSDDRVVNWAIERLKLTRKDKQLLKDLRAKVEEARVGLDPGEMAGRFDRFLRILENGERVAELGEETARRIGEQEAFRTLLEKHKEALLRQRVEEEVRQRGEEIAAAVAAEEERRRRVQREVQELLESFERLSQENQERFRKDNEARLRDLEAREAQVAQREEALADRERQVEARLERVVRAYREEAERIGDAFLAQLPLLRRAGLLSGGGGAEAEAARPAALSLPAFLATPRARGELGEEKFIEQLQHVVARRGFAFETEDLIHFHISVKTGPWTVLAGASGLGKSSLSRLYSEALGVVEEHLLLPVRPDWLDDRDVIGAFNALSGRYEPAPSGLVDHLIAAREDERAGRGGIWLVCLDEMNLARVEHYFAVFLSVLEQPPERRELRLFAQGLERPGDPYAAHRTIPLGTNLRFVGTVNIDETTHFFSPKVLDRAAVVALERPSLRQGLAEAARSAVLGGIVPVHLEEYRSWIRGPREAAGAETLELLLRIDEALRESHKGVGFRVRDRVLSYVASGKHLLGEERALDLAVFSNIAPRLRPDAAGAGKALEALRGLLPPGKFPRTARVLEALSEGEDDRDFFALL